jgi:toxin ParE1/3/4
MSHRLAPAAKTELDDIWRYLAVESSSTDLAGRVIDSITDRFFLLSTYPYVGRHRDDLRPGLRSFAVGEYVILYRVEGEDVLFLHVLRGNRDIEALFRH